MYAFDQPLPRTPPGWLHGTPVTALATLAALWLIAYLSLSEAAARVMGLAAAHGALLGTALAWTSTGDQRDRWAPIEAALVLGGHLLVNTSLTFGYRVRTGPLGELAEWWAYDLAANVLAAETFFRGALFERAYRRWAFAPAVALATAAAVLRYLADPLLPHTLGIAAGAVFYIALLGAGNCWLLARTGSISPALAAAALFFGAYRLLAPR